MVTNETWTINSAIQAVMRAPCTCTSTVNGWDCAEKSLEKYDGQNPTTTNAQIAIAADTYIPRSSGFQLARAGIVTFFCPLRICLSMRPWSQNTERLDCSRPVT